MDPIRPESFDASVRQRTDDESIGHIWNGMSPIASKSRFELSKSQELEGIVDEAYLSAEQSSP